MNKTKNVRPTESVSSLSDAENGAMLAGIATKVDFTNPEQLAHFLNGEPMPDACEQCWERWERKLNVGDEPGQVPFDVAIEQFDMPDFDPHCPSCVAGFEADIARQCAVAERYGKAA